MLVEISGWWVRRLPPCTCLDEDRHRPVVGVLRRWGAAVGRSVSHHGILRWSRVLGPMARELWERSLRTPKPLAMPTDVSKCFLSTYYVPEPVFNVLGVHR